DFMSPRAVEVADFMSPRAVEVADFMSPRAGRVADFMSPQQGVRENLCKFAAEKASQRAQKLLYSFSIPGPC
ncbi:MAG: hypothetical protein ACI4OX_08025, partial [Akkermansia sp.]